MAAEDPKKAESIYVFSAKDIDDIKVFVQVMDPMERLFSSLNSEKESTVHLCYPTVLVTLVFAIYVS